MMILGMEIDGNLIPVIAVTGAFVAAVFSILSGMVRKVMATRAREQSRREIAAYVAEGSMSAEEGERLLKAGLNDKGGGLCC